jgi:hypothetical protein
VGEGAVEEGAEGVVGLEDHYPSISMDPSELQTTDWRSSVILRQMKWSLSYLRLSRESVPASARKSLSSEDSYQWFGVLLLDGFAKGNEVSLLEVQCFSHQGGNQN